MRRSLCGGKEVQNKMAKAKMLPSGSWRVNLYVGRDLSGKRIYKSFTAPTKREAEYLAASYGVSGRNGTPTTELTLSEAYTRYIDSKSNVLSPSTVREYRAAAKRDFPALMPLRLKTLTQEQIQIAVNQMALNHSPKSVRNAHGLLSAVLSVYAPTMQLTTTLPQKIKNEIDIPTEVEVKALLEATEGKPLHIAILLGAVGTLRRSEVCALLKSDVTGFGVSINKAMVQSEKKEWVIKTTKTTAGTRFVELPRYVLDELKAVSTDRVYPFSPSTLTNRFALLSKAVLGRPLHFHALRHYAASALHALGVPDLYIMQRGGWKSRETLDRVYQHILSDEQKRYNDQITSHFEDAFGDDATRNAT